MKKFNKANFVSWIETLSDERVFNFSDNFNCLLASFLKEKLGCKDVMMGSVTYRVGKESDLRIPEWAREVASKARMANGEYNSLFSVFEVKKALIMMGI